MTVDYGSSIPGEEDLNTLAAKARTYNNGPTMRTLLANINPQYHAALTYMAAISAACMDDLMIAMDNTGPDGTAALARVESRLKEMAGLAESHSIRICANTSVALLVDRLRR